MQGACNGCGASAHTLNAGAALRIPTLFSCNLHATGYECILSTSHDGLYLLPTPLLPCTLQPVLQQHVRVSLPLLVETNHQLQARLHDLEVRGWR